MGPAVQTGGQRSRCWGVLELQPASVRHDQDRFDHRFFQRHRPLHGRAICAERLERGGHDAKPAICRELGWCCQPGGAAVGRDRFGEHSRVHRRGGPPLWRDRRRGQQRRLRPRRTLRGLDRGASQPATGHQRHRTDERVAGNDQLLPPARPRRDHQHLFDGGPADVPLLQRVPRHEVGGRGFFRSAAVRARAVAHSRQDHRARPNQDRLLRSLAGLDVEAGAAHIRRPPGEGDAGHAASRRHGSPAPRWSRQPSSAPPPTARPGCAIRSIPACFWQCATCWARGAS